MVSETDNELDEYDEDKAEPKVRGTPITRSGVRLIRVGWRAVGYSVESSVGSRYRLYSILLLVLAALVGIGVVYGASYLFFGFVSPLASQVLPMIKDYPGIFEMLIYFSTLVIGGAIYWHIRGKLGESMVRGRTPVHAGYSLFEQRRRGSLRRKRLQIPLLAVIAIVIFVPLGLSYALKMFLVLLGAFFLLEGIYFQFFAPRPPKKSGA